MADFDLPPEAILNYIERRKLDLKNCQQALIENDFESLSKIAHQIKGNAVSFGFEDLGNIAIDMEHFALKKDADGLISVMDRFKNFIASH